MVRGSRGWKPLFISYMQGVFTKKTNSETHPMAGSPGIFNGDPKNTGFPSGQLRVAKRSDLSEAPWLHIFWGEYDGIWIQHDTTV